MYYSRNGLEHSDARKLVEDMEKKNKVREIIRQSMAILSNENVVDLKGET